MAADLYQSRRRAAFIFLVPMLAVLALTAGYPLLRTMGFSLTDVTLDTMTGGYAFIGFNNYLEWYEGEWYGLLADEIWWRAVWNTIKFAAISVAIETVLGLLIALLLNATFPLRGWVRAAILIPWAVPTIVSAKMWAWMLNDQFGILNDVFLRLGLIDAPVAWTASADTALFAIIVADVWKTTPFMVLLILAGLQMLPRDCYEQARVDGVNPFTVFFKVTLPLVSPAIAVAVIFRALDALRIFDLIYVLTPNNEATASMSVFARQEMMDFSKLGYGSAASVMLFFIIAALTIIYIRMSRLNLGAAAAH